MNKLLAFMLLAAYVAAELESVQQLQTESESVQKQQTNRSDCFELDFENPDSFFTCVVKSFKAVSEAARSNNIEIANGVTFVRDIPMERTGKSLKKSEEEIMNELPRDLSDRSIKLINMMYDATVSFLKSHSLKINVPAGSIPRVLSEGRAKIKKAVWWPLVAALGLKVVSAVPILIGGLSLLTLKALFFGKIALLVAGVLAFQRLFGGSNVIDGFFNKVPPPPPVPVPAALWGHDSDFAGGSAGYNYAGYRNFKNDDAQDLAYSAHASFAKKTA